MIYIYDIPLDKKATTIKRYGVTYKLEKRFRMGERKFVSFVAPGNEKILVVPDFAIQYTEVEGKLARFPKGKSFTVYKDLVMKRVDATPAEEDFPNELSDTGVMKTLTCRYKDIKVTFDYMNDELTLEDEFEICDNNIFGNGIVVLMHMDVEEA